MWAFLYVFNQSESFMHLTFTPFYAGLLSLLYIFLSLRVILFRRKHKIGVGHGDERSLEKAIRVHGNFIEYVPLALFLVLTLELNGTEQIWLHLLGGTLVFGRMMHAIGLGKSTGVTAPRFVGTLLTFIVIIVAAIKNIMVVYQ